MIRGRSLRFWLARGALELYPLAYRERYREELSALLEDCPATVGTVFDLLFGALDAHLRPGRLVASPSERMRGTISAAVVLWIAVTLVGAAFAKTTEDSPFRAAEAAHPVLGGVRVAVIVLAVVGGLAVILGGGPVAISIVRQAWDGRSRELRRAVAAPLVATACFAASTAVVAVIASGTHGNTTPLSNVAFVVWVALGVCAAAVCALGARWALQNARLGLSTLALAGAGAWLLARIIAALTIAIALYTVLLSVYAGNLQNLSNTPLQVPTSVSLALEVAALFVIAVLAFVTARRGWRSAAPAD